MAQNNAFLAKLNDPEQTILVAEGYLFEMERRGYLKAGVYVPEVVLNRPDLVKVLTEEMVNAGSDVAVAFTYYAQKDRLKLLNREDETEKLHRKAIQIAKEVAKEHPGALVAGNLCATSIYDPSDESKLAEVKKAFTDQVQWAKEEGVDYIIAETFPTVGEALLALQAIIPSGIPCVVTLAPGLGNFTQDNMSVADACRLLEENGADVVGLNCSRGPKTILPLIKTVRAACTGPIACLPVAFRTDHQNVTMQNLPDKKSGLAFPLNLDPWHCSRNDVAKFAMNARKNGVRYFGLCCGGAAHYIRTMSETLGRAPPASHYAPDMSQMYGFTTNFTAH